MAYANNYSAEDISAITIDLIAGIGVGGVAFVSIIALILIGKYVLKQWKK